MAALESALSDKTTVELVRKFITEGSSSALLVERAVEAAQRAFPAWAGIGPEARGKLLLRLADLIGRIHKH